MLRPLIFTLILFSFNYSSYAQCPGSIEDCDGDGILNLDDDDDDNDGIIDNLECPLNFVNIRPNTLIPGGGVYVNQSVTNVDISTVLGVAPGNIFISATGINKLAPNLFQTGSVYGYQTTFTITGPMSYLIKARLQHGAFISSDTFDQMSSTNGVTYDLRTVLGALFFESNAGANYSVGQSNPMGTGQANPNGAFRWFSTTNGATGFTLSSDDPGNDSACFFALALDTDTDGDGLADCIDYDSDDDGCNDAIEAGFDDDDFDDILGTSPVTVNGQGRVNGQGGYTGHPADVTTAASYADTRCTVLPVTWCGIDLEEENCETTINWMVCTERNNNYFKIEMSEDGVNWIPLGRVKSRGDSQNLTKYSVSFNLTNRKNLLNYFRVRQVDFDGNNSFSDIISHWSNSNCFSQSESAITVNNNEVIGLGNSARINSYSLVNSLGQLISKTSFNNSSNEALVLELSQLNSGVYFLLINDSNLRKVIVAK